MGLGRRDNKSERPYVINYIRGQRRLSDSAVTLDGALARISERLAKRHNKGETAEVWHCGERVYTTTIAADHTPALVASLTDVLELGCSPQAVPHHPVVRRARAAIARATTPAADPARDVEGRK
jgi:hypothetical protein